MVLLQAGSVQAESCYFWLVLNNRGSCQTNPWFFDPLQTGLTEWLSMSWVSLRYPCERNRGPDLCWGVPEAAIKTWQNSLHGISMMEKGLSACRFSHMQSTYHLLGDLFAISQICFRCSLYGLISTWGEEGLSITLNFLQHVEPVQEPSALDAWPLASPTQTKTLLLIAKICCINTVLQAGWLAASVTLHHLP